MIYKVLLHIILTKLIFKYKMFKNIRIMVQEL